MNLNHIEDTSADTIGGDDPRGALTFDPAMTSLQRRGASVCLPEFSAWNYDQQRAGAIRRGLAIPDVSGRTRFMHRTISKFCRL